MVDADELCYRPTVCLLDSPLTIGDEKGCASLQHRAIAWQRLVSNISPSARPIMRSHLKPGSYRPNLGTVRSIISRREDYLPQRCHSEVRGVAVSPSHVLESCQQPSTGTARSSSANRTGDTTWSEISAAYHSAAIARTILCNSSPILSRDNNSRLNSLLCTMGSELHQMYYIVTWETRHFARLCSRASCPGPVLIPPKRLHRELSWR